MQPFHFGTTGHALAVSTTSGKGGSSCVGRQIGIGQMLDGPVPIVQDLDRSSRADPNSGAGAARADRLTHGIPDTSGIQPPAGMPLAPPRLQCLLLRPHVVVDFKRRVPWLFISSSGATAPQKNEDQNDKRGNDREIHQPQQQREAHAPLQRENQPVRCARRRNVAPYGGFHPHDRLQPPANRSARALCKRHRFRLFHARNLLRRRVDRVSFRRASGARCARNATAPDGRRRSVHHSPKRSALTIVGPTNTSLRCVFRRP